MKQMEEVWNKNITYEFKTSWINVIDTVMMEWYNNFAPWFMCVGSKQHPFFNDHHTICCGITYILWRVKIVKAGYIPEHLGPNLHSDIGRTVLLVFRMCEPLFYKGKSIVMKINFCVANGIVAIVAKGVHVGALVNKRRYWPKIIPGDIIDRYFSTKEVGGVDMSEAAT